MRIQFQIHYQTIPGQQIIVRDLYGSLSDNDGYIFKLNYLANGYWIGEARVADNIREFLYQYALVEANGELTNEWGEPRLIPLDRRKEAYFLHDNWRAPSGAEKNLRTSAFQKVLMKPNQKAKGATSKAKKTLQFQIDVSRIAEDCQICVMGNQEVLGNWDKNRPLLLSCSKDFPTWSGSINFDNIIFPLKYKYGIYNTKTKSLEMLEGGTDRHLYQLKINEPSFTYVRSDESFRYPQGEWRGAGVAVPVFSLRGEKSNGVGDFNDLKDFIDWAKMTSLKMVQILPINETIATKTWLDSYPYKSISVTALHPIYLNLDKMGRLEDKKSQQHFDEKSKELNAQEYVNYPAVMEMKTAYFQHIFNQEGDKVLKSKAFKDFFKNNRDWLVPHAAFCYFRDKFGTADFRQWGEHANYYSKSIEMLAQPKSEAYPEIAKQYFIQFHLDQQLREAAEHARENGIVLKGDIPIGISPNSVEAWTEPHLFHLDAQAGAPPDDFAVKGQNWGFPTYNWSAIATSRFQWWKKRLQKMAEYFDAYRIDHILGFLRIWEIPIHAVEGILGYFNKALPMTMEEIQGYGIFLEADRMAQPYITTEIINNVFGQNADTVTEQFLLPNADDANRYHFKPEFDTQRKVNAYFLDGIEEEELTPDKKAIRDGLFDLHANVLFVRTAENEWHPRITIQKTNSYAALDPSTQTNLENLYNHFFFKRHNDFWYVQGMDKLPEIMTASEMLVCGEDLGMIPDCVPELMNNLDVLSLEIQRMPKKPGLEFAHPMDAPYLSVCTTSTHDMATIRGWWEEDRTKSQRFYNNELGNRGAAPHFAEPFICQQIIIQHLHSPAMWTTFPIQDLLAMDGDLRWDNTAEEKINEPSNVRHHWRYRMHQSIEELKNATDFNGLLKRYVEESGRSEKY